MSQQQPHRRFFSDGRGIWYIDRFWKLAEGLPTEDLLVEKVRVLDEVCWFSERWGKRPTCRAVIEHCQRILAADMSYPVILAPNDDVLDGVHRIAKAMVHGQTTVKAVRLPEMPPPDELLSQDDPRYDAPPAAGA